MIFSAPSVFLNQLVEETEPRSENLEVTDTVPTESSPEEETEPRSENLEVTDSVPTESSPEEEINRYNFYSAAFYYTCKETLQIFHIPKQMTAKSL